MVKKKIFVACGIILFGIILGIGGFVGVKLHLDKEAYKIEQETALKAEEALLLQGKIDDKDSKRFILAEVNGSSESGLVSIKDIQGKAYVILSLNGQPASVSQPANIHIGSCPTVGAIQYPLNPIVEGKSITKLSINTEQLLSSLPMAVNVQKSAQEKNVSVACANFLVMPTTPLTVLPSVVASPSASAVSSASAQIKR